MVRGGARSTRAHSTTVVPFVSLRRFRSALAPDGGALQPPSASPVRRDAQPSTKPPGLMSENARRRAQSSSRGREKGQLSEERHAIRTGLRRRRIERRYDLAIRAKTLEGTCLGPRTRY